MASPTDTQTVVATAVFIDLVGFSKIPTSAQITIKQRLKQVLDAVVGRMDRADFWVRDLGDGALLVFPHSPEHGLYVALAVNKRFAQASAGADVPAQTRTGIHLGVIKTSIDLEGRVNFLGDGLNAAQRVMDFAQPGKIMASRTFVDAVGMLHADIEHLFSHPQTRQDKHGRSHEIFEAGFSQTLLDRLESEATRPGHSAPAATAPQPVTPSAARPTRTLAWAVAGVAAVAVAAALLWHPMDTGPAPATPAPPQTAPANVTAPPDTADGPSAARTPPPAVAPEPAARTNAAPKARAVPPAPAAAATTRTVARPPAAPATAPATPAQRASCTAILNKAALGAPLSEAERKVLMDTCQ
ncbi:MAG: hypothetical protein RBS27_14040 [Giesbergeria sp.]|nr:hypothetical protein [Giesbergeria sp.]